MGGGVRPQFVRRNTKDFINAIFPFSGLKLLLIAQVRNFEILAHFNAPSDLNKNCVNNEYWIFFFHICLLKNLRIKHVVFEPNRRVEFSTNIPRVVAKRCISHTSHRCIFFIIANRAAGVLQKEKKNTYALVRKHPFRCSTIVRIRSVTVRYFFDQTNSRMSFIRISLAVNTEHVLDSLLSQSFDVVNLSHSAV